MNRNQKKQVDNWEVFFKDRGISKHLIDQYIPYIEKLTLSGLPIIFEVEHLSKLIGISLNELYKIIGNTSHYYRQFTIPKRKGGKRIVSAPYPSILMCQTWIYENILSTVTLHHSAHAYRKNHSIVTNALPHINQTALLKMDMADFFPSIPKSWVINFFSQLGYSNNISYYLATICCLNNALPQGAPTSPALSNILLTHLDKRLYKLSRTYKLNYTRYADDLTFSGSYIPHKLINEISNIVSDFGLMINKNKSNLIIGNKQKIVTGLSVQGTKLSLPRSTRRQIKQEVHYIREYGLVSHISKLKIRNPYYLDSLEGKLRFWLQIEPENEFAQKSLNFIIDIRTN